LLSLGDRLREKLVLIQEVAASLAEARAELAKATGMNPKTVLQILRSLEPLWPPVADEESFRSELMNVLEAFGAKLSEAIRKAIDTEDEKKKLNALLAFARDTDKAQEALVQLSPGLEVEANREALSRVIADERLKVLESELANEKGGLNSLKVLAGVQDLAATWKDLGGTSPMEAAFDAVAKLRARIEEIHSKVRSRMAESMTEAVETSNKKKKEALLKFAGEFDLACKSLAGPETSGELGNSLVAELKAKAAE